MLHALDGLTGEHQHQQHHKNRIDGKKWSWKQYALAPLASQLGQTQQA